MKKWYMVMVIVMLATLLAACGGGSGTNDNTPDNTTGTGGTNATTNNGGNNEPEEPAGGDVPTAEELITNIAAASQALESFSMEMVSDQDMVFDGESQNMKMSVKSDMIQNPLTAYQEMSIEMPGLGETQEVIQYITAEGIYMYTADQWMQLPGEADMIAQIQEQASPETQLEYFKAIANETTVTEEGDNYVLTADVSGENVKELSREIMGSAGGGADPNMEAMMDQMNIEKMLLVYTVRKDDYLPVTMNIEMSMKMEQDGSTMEMDMKMDSTFSNYNEIDEITVPEEALNAPSMGDSMPQLEQ
ncbi:DUF6612 family protein [Paenibacillus sp. 1P07SE]|uniref:DUF6612 family protein n=1 Tax=Paenibacillus sp. 1P07SE TaxID=3132209 RepID=UPI0039A73BED